MGTEKDVSGYLDAAEYVGYLIGVSEATFKTVSTLADNLEKLQKEEITIADFANEFEKQVDKITKPSHHGWRETYAKFQGDLRKIRGALNGIKEKTNEENPDKVLQV